MTIIPLEGYCRSVDRRKAHEMTRGYENTTDRYLTRLRRIEGQVRLQRMVSEGDYRIDILTQMSAVQSALDSVAIGLLEDHMNHCVVNAAKESDEAGREKIEEATKAIARLIKS